MMPKKVGFIPPRPARERIGVDTRQYSNPEEWIRAAGTDNDFGDDPEGTMRLAVHLNASHHLALQIAAQERHIPLAELIESMVEQLPEYQKVYGSKS